MRYILLILCLFVAANTVSAQTYYYKFLYAVNPETGEKTKEYGDVYVTFSNNKKTCYESDENGYAKRDTEYNHLRPSRYSAAMAECSSDGIFRYFSNSNDVITYRLEYTVYFGMYNIFTTRVSEKHYRYLNFSKDLSRLNIVYGDTKIVVAERTYKPGEEPIPNQLF